MLRSLYTAATGMQAQQVQMDLIANNLANSGTVGYKSARPEFEDLYSEQIRAAAPSEGGSAPAPLEVGLGVRTGATTRYLAQGQMTNTQNPTWPSRGPATSASSVRTTRWATRVRATSLPMPTGG